MPEPFLRPRASLSSSRDGWFRRMRENLQQVFASARIFPSSASGAPLHLLPSPPASPANGSRTISLLAHVLLISGVLLLHVELRQPRAGSAGPADSLHPRAFFPLPDPSLFGQPSVGVKGGGGENDPRPARHGDLAPASSRPLLPPRAIVNPLPELPVPASVFDANASPLPPLITRTRREQAPAKAIPTVAPTRTGSPCPFACIVPSRNTPTKHARPSSKEESHCAFWWAPTAGLRRFKSFSASPWGSTNAPSNPYAPGNLFPRTTPPAERSHLGSRSKLSSASSSHAGVAPRPSHDRLPYRLDSFLAQE
jgi:hypothetical protein